MYIYILSYLSLCVCIYIYIMYIYILSILGWSKPAKRSKHALAVGGSCTLREANRADCNILQHIDTILPHAASGSKRELNKFSLFTCNLRSTEIFLLDLKCRSMQSSWSPLKSFRFQWYKGSRVVALGSKSLCHLLSALQPMQEPNSSWCSSLHCCPYVPYLLCVCVPAVIFLKFSVGRIL